MKPTNFIKNLICISLLVSFYTAFQLDLVKHSTLPYYDEATYTDVSHNILHSGLPYRSIGKEPGELYLFHPPLARYVVSGFMALLGNSLQTARIVSTLAAGLIIILLFMTLQRYVSIVVALLCCLLLACHSMFIVFGNRVYVEMLLSCFSLLSFVALASFLDNAKKISSTDNDWKKLLLPGLFCGLALSAKYTAVLFIIPMTIWIYIVRKSLNSAIFFFVLSCSVLIAWFCVMTVIEPLALKEQVASVLAQVLGKGEFASWHIPLSFFLFKDFLPAIGVSFILSPILTFLLIKTKSKQPMPSSFHCATAIIVLTIGASFLVGYKQLRYTLPILPFLSFTLAMLLQRLQDVQKSTTLTIAIVLFALLSSSPIVDQIFKISNKLVSLPKSYAGYYTEAKKNDQYYKGLHNIASDIKQHHKSDPTYVVGKPDITNRLLVLAPVRRCRPKSCKELEPEFLLLNTDDSRQRKIVRESIDDINNYVHVRNYVDLGERLDKKLQLWQRKTGKDIIHIAK